MSRRREGSDDDDSDGDDSDGKEHENGQRCKDKGGTPENEGVQRCLDDVFKWEDHSFYPAVKSKEGTMRRWWSSDQQADYNEEDAQKVVELEDRINKAEGGKGKKWKNRSKKKRKKLVKKYKSKLKYRFGKQELHSKAFPEHLEPLDELLDWRRIAQKNGDTVYEYNCNSNQQKNDGLCKFMNSKYNEKHKFCGNEYGMYGTFEKQDVEESIKEDGWSLVSISIHCANGEVFYDLKVGKHKERSNSRSSRGGRKKGKKKGRRRLLATRTGMARC